MKPARESESSKERKQIAKNRIFIIGSHNLRNEILGYLLEREVYVKCRSGQDLRASGFAVDSVFTGQTMLLVDCLNEDLKSCKAKKSSFDEGIRSGAFVVPYDVRRGAGIEEVAVKWGLRGLFYEDDRLEDFLRGIEAIFRGELWLSKEIMSRHILGEYGHKDKDEIPARILTKREADVLEAISSGAKNEEIAKELHVSVSTVKTHIYHIYKKIHVSNRLQAALWAAKFL